MSEACPLLLALILGAVIGFERRLNGHVAGLHTHAMVALGAALFILLGMKQAAPNETARIAAQIVMAAGFLCGSIVMRDGLQVRGLNTAVTIWCSCAVGALAGAGFYGPAIMGAVIITCANCLLHILEYRMGWLEKPCDPNHDPKQPPHN